MKKQEKQIISMNVDKDTYTKFSELCRKKGLIMSRLVENFMKEKIGEEK